MRRLSNSWCAFLFFKLFVLFFTFINYQYFFSGNTATLTFDCSVPNNGPKFFDLLEYNNVFVLIHLYFLIGFSFFNL